MGSPLRITVECQDVDGSLPRSGGFDLIFRHSCQSPTGIRARMALAFEIGVDAFCRRFDVVLVTPCSLGALAAKGVVCLEVGDHLVIRPRQKNHSPCGSVSEPPPPLRRETPAGSTMTLTEKGILDEEMSHQTLGLLPPSPAAPEESPSLSSKSFPPPFHGSKAQCMRALTLLRGVWRDHHRAFKIYHVTLSEEDSGKASVLSQLDDGTERRGPNLVRVERIPHLDTWFIMWAQSFYLQAGPTDNNVAWAPIQEDSGKKPWRWKRLAPNDKICTMSKASR